MQLICKTVWWFLKMLKSELLYDPAIPILDTYSREWEKNHPHKNLYIATLPLIRQKWKQLKCPWTDEWKQCMIYPQMEYYSSIKKEWDADTCYNRDELWKHDNWKKSDTISSKCMTHFVWYVQTWQSHGDKKHISCCQKLVEERRRGNC